MTARKTRAFFAVLLPDCYPISVSRCYRNSAASRNQLRPLLFAVGADQHCV